MKQLKHTFAAPVFGFCSMALCSALLALAATDAAELISLGDLPGGDNFSAAYDLSADGKTVLGSSSSESGYQTFRWTAETGFQIIPAFNAEAISADGNVVVGSLATLTLEAVKWSEAAGVVSLGLLPTQPGFAEFSAAFDTSADGSTIVGVGATMDSPFSEAVLWNAELGLVPLGFLPDDLPERDAFSLSYANAISANGQVVVGASLSTKHLDRGEMAFRWTEDAGMEPLGFLPGAFQSQGTAVSADGSVIAGVSGMEAFRWTASTGLEPIGSFLPTSISSDGAVIVGRGYTELGELAFVWTSQSGAVPLQSWLEQSHGLTLTGWQLLSDAVSVSQDGSVIAGTGVNSAGSMEAFVVVLAQPTPPTSASVTLSGSAQLSIVDSSGRRFGADPLTGEQRNEIPGLTVTVADGATTYSWPDLADGAYQFNLVGTSAGNYELKLNFSHADGKTSGQVLASRLGAGGVHTISAELLAASAADTRISQTYSDSDGDKIVDSSDSVLFSDLRATVFIAGNDTGVRNKVLSSGATINDIIAGLLKNSVTHSTFVSQLSKTTTQLTAAGTITNEEKRQLSQAAAHFNSKQWKSAKDTNMLLGKKR
jgi:probable HAF family extracellular repeat protein